MIKKVKDFIVEKSMVAGCVGLLFVTLKKRLPPKS